jgi:hypothetical protein
MKQSAVGSADYSSSRHSSSNSCDDRLHSWLPCVSACINCPAYLATATYCFTQSHTISYTSILKSTNNSLHSYQRFEERVTLVFVLFNGAFSTTRVIWSRKVWLCFRNSKWCGTKQPWLILRHYAGITIRIRNTLKTLPNAAMRSTSYRTKCTWQTEWRMLMFVFGSSPVRTTDYNENIVTC